jgi:hypothetical protein
MLILAAELLSYKFDFSAKFLYFFSLFYNFWVNSMHLRLSIFFLVYFLLYFTPIRFDFLTKLLEFFIILLSSILL